MEDGRKIVRTGEEVSLFQVGWDADGAKTRAALGKYTIGEITERTVKVTPVEVSDVDNLDGWKLMGIVTSKDPRPWDR